MLSTETLSTPRSILKKPSIQYERIIIMSSVIKITAHDSSAVTRGFKGRKQLGSLLPIGTPTNTRTNAPAFCPRILDPPVLECLAILWVKSRAVTRDVGGRVVYTHLISPCNVSKRTHLFLLTVSNNHNRVVSFLPPICTRQKRCRVWTWVVIAHGPGVAQVISLQVVRRGELIPARPVEVIVSTISPTGSCVYTLVVVEEIA